MAIFGHFWPISGQKFIRVVKKHFKFFSSNIQKSIFDQTCNKLPKIQISIFYFDFLFEIDLELSKTYFKKKISILKFFRINSFWDLAVFTKNGT